MNKLSVFLLVMAFFFIQTVPCAALLYYSEVGTTYINYATAYSNGYKIVPIVSEDTLYAVYSYNEDTCCFAYSHDRGITWESHPFTATQWGNAHYPSLDVYNSLPYVVSEGDSAGKGEIFLKCPLDWGVPQRISYTHGHSTLPGIAIDDSGNMHIVWQDDTPGNWEIYYCCAHYDTNVSDTVNVSNYSDATDVYPSISIYNGNEVHVIWERYDPNSYSPYSIVHRYLSGGNWSIEDTLAGSTHVPLHHPSLDYCNGEDNLSAAWEDSSLGKLDVYFYGGNGGGLQTQGYSRYPVVSTMDSVYSYLYWEDNSEGYDDIYAHLYFSMSGWSSYKFRDVFGNEDMHHPSVTNCYVVWTQGDMAPYRVMFACEGYPGGVEESQTMDNKIPELQVYPNPFTKETVIEFRSSGVQEFNSQLPNSSTPQLTIYDVSGRLVKSFPLTTNHFSLGTDFNAGIYFLKAKGYKPVKITKLQ